MSTKNSPSSGVSDALQRLNKALDSLDGIVGNTVESRSKVRSADEEVQRMADDRSRLAQELDQAEAKSKRLGETNSEVSRRLVGAMEMVRGVLDQKA